MIKPFRKKNTVIKILGSLFFTIFTVYTCLYVTKILIQNGYYFWVLTKVYFLNLYFSLNNNSYLYKLKEIKFLHQDKYILMWSWEYSL